MQSEFEALTNYLQSMLGQMMKQTKLLTEIRNLLGPKKDQLSGAWKAVSDEEFKRIVDAQPIVVKPDPPKGAPPFYRVVGIDSSMNGRVLTVISADFDATTNALSLKVRMPPPPPPYQDTAIVHEVIALDAQGNSYPLDILGVNRITPNRMSVRVVKP